MYEILGIFKFCRADHEDQEIVMYNRAMLPAYYGILRMMCQQSRVFTRSLAQHQNLQWAFKNITPHPTQYPMVSISSSSAMPLPPLLIRHYHLLGILFLCRIQSNIPIVEDSMSENQTNSNCCILDAPCQKFTRSHLWK